MQGEGRLELQVLDYKQIFYFITFSAVSDVRLPFIIVHELCLEFKLQSTLHAESDLA